MPTFCLEYLKGGACYRWIQVTWTCNATGAELTVNLGIMWIYGHGNLCRWLRKAYKGEGKHCCRGDMRAKTTVCLHPLGFPTCWPSLWADVEFCSVKVTLNSSNPSVIINISICDEILWGSYDELSGRRRQCLFIVFCVLHQSRCFMRNNCSNYAFHFPLWRTK